MVTSTENRIFEWVKEKNYSSPVKCEMDLRKVWSNNYDNESRYFYVKIDGQDVTQMVANCLHLRTSKAKDTHGCLIIHGGGMDMAFAIQNDLHWRSLREGFGDLFDEHFYKDI